MGLTSWRLTPAGGTGVALSAARVTPQSAGGLKTSGATVLLRASQRGQFSIHNSSALNWT